MWKILKIKILFNSILLEFLNIRSHIIVYNKQLTGKMKLVNLETISLKMEPIFIWEIPAVKVCGVCYEQNLKVNYSLSCSHFGYFTVTSKI